MLRPPPPGTEVQFHHPVTGWTWGVVRKVIDPAEDLEDVPHWGCWLVHPTLGNLWVMGAEIMEQNSGKQAATRHI